MNSPKDKLIVALDVFTFEEARMLVDVLKDDVDIFKIGSQLFTACGPVAVRYVLSLGKKVFLDLKFHDIPNTVASAVSSAIQMGQADGQGKSIFMCTLHIDGGIEMMKRAVEAAVETAKQWNVPKPLLLGITVLTSEVSTQALNPKVIEKAKLAQAAGLDGVVASSHEVAALRKEMGKDFVIVTPGIRPAGADVGDQKRVSTPADAIKNGSSYLVIGRPIVKAENPQSAAQAILGEIKDAMRKLL